MSDDIKLYDKISILDVIYGCTFVPEGVLKETEVITITERKILKDKKEITKVLVITPIDEFFDNHTIIEYISK